MADTLEIFGTEYTNVAGIKATNNNNTQLIYLRLDDGDNLSYGITDGTLPLAGVGKAGSMVV